ncbi:MAG: cellulase family glycosylhydrolase [Chloroflexi bacterium]|nr:cellulase family glycosylhydrolase [Chloroflexota bacterium]
MKLLLNFASKLHTHIMLAVAGGFVLLAVVLFATPSLASPAIYTPRVNNLPYQVYTVGQGSAYPQTFVDAYNREGGTTRLGQPADVVREWGSTGVYWQPFNSGIWYSPAIFHHQTGGALPGDIRAFIIGGGIRDYYIGLGGPSSWLGSPTSGEFINNAQQYQVNFSSGYVVWTAATGAQVYVWPNNFTGWKTQYYNNAGLYSGPSLFKNEGNSVALNFDHNEWQAGLAPLPDQGLTFSDHWSARWERSYTITPGSYQFTLCGNDGVRLYLDGTMVIDEWRTQDYTCFSYPALNYQVYSNSTTVSIRIEYYQDTGSARVSFALNKLMLPSTKRVYGQLDFTSNTVNNGGVSNQSLSGSGGVALDKSGGFYVSDSFNHRVLYFPSGSLKARWVYGQPDFTSNSGGINNYSLKEPHGLAVDSNGGFYIADSGNNRVLYYPNGSIVATRVYGQPDFISSVANNGGVSDHSLNNPIKIALDSNNDLYVADTNNNRVLYYHDGSVVATQVYGQPDFTSSTAGVGPANLNGPYGVALDNKGGLYVGDTFNHRVLYFPSGSFTANQVYGQSTFTSNVSNQGGVSSSSFDLPVGITVDSYGGFYVADQGNNRVLYFGNGNVNAIRVYGQPDFTSNVANNGGVVSERGLNGVFDVAIDITDSLYAADYSNNRILFFGSGDPSSLVVRKSLDDGTSSTLSYALRSAGYNDKITFALTTGNSVTITTALYVPPGASLESDCSTGPAIIIDGAGLRGVGLTLQGSTLLKGLRLRGFRSTDLKIAGNNNHLDCVNIQSIASQTLGVAINLHTTDTNTDKKQLELADQLNAKIIRIGVSWRLLERPKKGQFNYGDNWYLNRLDGLVSQAKAKNLKIIFVFGETPCWASAQPDKICDDVNPDNSKYNPWYPPNNPQEYADALAYLVNLYRDKSQILAWEVWNEPNCAMFWGRQGCDATAIAEPDAARYVELLMAAYIKAKLTNPSAVILGASLAGGDVIYLNWMYKHNVKGYFDALALHPYSVDDAPEVCNGSAGHRWSYKCGLEDVQSFMQNQGDNRPIWITEVGWTTGGVTLEQQKDYLERALRVWQNWDNVPVLIWYCLIDRDYDDPYNQLSAKEKYFGLYRADLSPKPAVESYKRASP